LLRKEGDPALHAALWADLLDTTQLWQQVLDTGLIDTGEPVGLLLVAMLHFVPDDRDPIRAVRWLQERLVPESFLVLSHATGEALLGEGRGRRPSGSAPTTRNRPPPRRVPQPRAGRRTVRRLAADRPRSGMDPAVAGRVRAELRRRSGPRVHPGGTWPASPDRDRLSSADPG